MSLRDQLSREVDAWVPENPGDEVYGTVVSVGERDGGTWGPYPYVEIDDDKQTNLQGVHAYHTILRNEVAGKKIQVGDTLGVRYLGKKAPKKEGLQPYENYRVVHQRGEGSSVPEVQPDWEGLKDNESLIADEVGSRFEATTVDGDGVPF